MKTIQVMNKHFCDRIETIVCEYCRFANYDFSDLTYFCNLTDPITHLTRGFCDALNIWRTNDKVQKKFLCRFDISDLYATTNNL